MNMKSVWIPDLTICGDVESNPGPTWREIKALTIKKVGDNDHDENLNRELAKIETGLQELFPHEIVLTDKNVKAYLRHVRAFGKGVIDRNVRRIVSEVMKTEAALLNQAGTVKSVAWQVGDTVKVMRTGGLFDPGWKVTSVTDHVINVEKLEDMETLRKSLARSKAGQWLRIDVETDHEIPSIPPSEVLESKSEQNPSASLRPSPGSSSEDHSEFSSQTTKITSTRRKSCRPGLQNRAPFYINEQQEIKLRRKTEGLFISPFLRSATCLGSVATTHDIPRKVKRLANKAENLHLDEWAQEAIRHSLVYGHLNKLMNEKAKRSGHSLHEQYIRVDVYGKKVQSPCLLEIWPGQHYSPIHEHSKSYGIVKGMIGRVEIMLFDSLTGDPKALYTVDKTSTAWMSPDAYQVHQVFCPMAEGDYAATFHIYSKTKDDYFRYVDSKGAEHRFLTRSDITWKELSEILKTEGEYNVEEPNRK